MVHAYDDRLVHTLVPLERGTEVSHVGSDIAEALEGVPLEQARELASSKTSPFNNYPAEDPPCDSCSCATARPTPTSPASSTPPTRAST